MPESLFDTTELPTKHLADNKEDAGGAQLSAAIQTAAGVASVSSEQGPVPEAKLRQPEPAPVKTPEKAFEEKPAPPNPEKPVEKPMPRKPEKPMEKAFKPEPAPGTGRRPAPSSPKELNGEERQLFSYFLEVEGMEDQIKNTVAHISDQ